MKKIYIKTLILMLLLLSSANAIEDFTTYNASNDPNSVFTVDENTISWVNLDRDCDAYVYYDKGVDHFNDDFTHQFEVQFSNGVASSKCGFWILANALDDHLGLKDADEDFYYLDHYNNAGELWLTFAVCEDGELTVDRWKGPLTATTYYITITRDDDAGANSTGQVTVEIHTGDYHPDGVHKDLLTVDCSAGEQNDFRYIYGAFSHNSGHNQEVDGFTENLNLGEATIAPIGFHHIKTHRR